jgi:hypothetical protein
MVGWASGILGRTALFGRRVFTVLPARRAESAWSPRGLLSALFCLTFAAAANPADAGPNPASAEICTNASSHIAASAVVASTAPDAVVGEPIAFDWHLADKESTASEAGRIPAYLILALPETTRFEGRGFYAITPGAEGPYGVLFGSGRTRAIVPLHTRFAEPSGRIEVLAYRAGPMQADWALVEAGACGERIVASGRIDIDVAPGAARLLGRDEFASRKPSQEIVPLNGPFFARVFDEAIEVVDRLSGEVVLQAAGSNPVFSPTGRFLAIETPQEQISDVYDLLTERRLGRFQSIAMYWSHADSFLYLEQEWEGEIQILRTLAGRRESPQDAPRQAALIDAAGNDEETPADAIHPGPDIGVDDIDTGAGGGSFTNGSEAWSLDVSLEGGFVALLQTNPLFYDEPTEEMPGAVIDLGLMHPMISTATVPELKTVVQSDFGVDEPTLSGWNVHGALRQTFAYYDEEPADGDEEPADGDVESPDTAEPADDESDRTAFADWMQPEAAPLEFDDAPTQNVSQHTVEIAAADVGDGTLRRSAVSLVASIGPTVRVAGDGLNLLPNMPLESIRSGDAGSRKALAGIARELDELYGNDVARFEPAAVEGDYRTSPFPPPRPKMRPEEPTVIDLQIPGRDSWRWTIGKNRYWLTQTVESGRLSHAFSFTLLGLDNGRVIQADLLEGLALGAESLAAEGDPYYYPLGLLDRGDVREDLGKPFAEPSFAAIAGGRYLLLATRPLLRLIVFDLDRWKPVCSVPAPTAGTDLDRLSLTSDIRHLVQFNGNGLVEIYSCADGTRVLSGVVADDEFVVMDDRGYFDGSEDATAYMELKIAGLPGRHLLSQFAARLRYPGLAQAVLSGKAGARPPVLLDPPSLTVSAVPNGAFRFEARARGGLKSLDILAGGRLVRSIPLAGPSASLDIAAAELPAVGYASILAVDDDGLTSPPLDLVLPGNGNISAGRLFGLSIGIDHYFHLRGLDLRFAAADARRIAKATGSSPAFAGTDVRTLLDGEATEAAILGRLDAMVSTAGPGDTVLLSFAGHGLVGENGGLRLALSNTDPDHLDATTLSIDDITGHVRSAAARVVLLLDACHSGVSERAATNDDAVRRFTTSSGAGIAILAASKGRQFSEEVPSLHGGRFSVAIDGALSEDRAAADLDGNGRISLLELYRAVKSEVGNGSQGRQVPWIARNRIYGDFDLF